MRRPKLEREFCYLDAETEERIICQHSTDEEAIDIAVRMAKDTNKHIVIEEICIDDKSVLVWPTGKIHVKTEFSEFKNPALLKKDMKKYSGTLR